MSQREGPALKWSGPGLRPYGHRKRILCRADLRSWGWRSKSRVRFSLVARISDFDDTKAWKTTFRFGNHTHSHPRHRSVKPGRTSRGRPPRWTNGRRRLLRLRSRLLSMRHCVVQYSSTYDYLCPAGHSVLPLGQIWPRPPLPRSKDCRSLSGEDEDAMTRFSCVNSCRAK